MAASGFFYTGPNDLVECYHCGVKLKSWKTFHSPYFEHEQWSKSCPCVGQYHITKSYIKNSIRLIQDAHNTCSELFGSTVVVR